MHHKITFILFLSLITTCVTAQHKKTLYIADHTAACGEEDCLQIKTKNKAGWSILKDSISGFNYQEGYEYKIKVKETKGTPRYTLLQVVNQKKTNYLPVTKLENKKWVLVSMFDSLTTLGIGDTTIYIQLDMKAGKLSGHGVCNHLRASVKNEGSQLTFGKIGFTKMKCPSQGNILEKIIENLLEATDSYTLKGNTLILLSQKGSYLVFKAY